MKSVRYHQDARVELVHEVTYYTTISRKLGERFDRSVQAVARLAAEFPELGSPYFYGTRRVFPKKFRFSVVYLVADDEIFILAIAPFKKKPGYWRSRADDA